LKRQNDNLKSILAIVFLCLVAFRGVLFSPGLVGRTWDWATFTLRDQALILETFYQYSWWGQIALGFPITYNANFYSDSIIYWLSYLLGGVLASKLIFVLFLILGAHFMYLYCRKLGIGPLSALIGAIFYIFNPPVYSRIVTGHVSVLLGYALMPVFLILLADAIKGGNSFFIKSILAGIVLSVLGSSHQMVLGCAFIITLVMILGYLFSRRYFFRALSVGCIVLFVFTALSMYWIYPFFKNMASGSATYFRGDISVQEELVPRIAKWKSTSNNFFNAVIMKSRLGMDTENVYPIPKLLIVPWYISGYIILLLICLSFFKKPYMRIKWIFAIIALIGVFLTTGYNTFLGRLLYERVLMKVMAVFFEYSVTNRFALLVFLSYAVLLAYGLDVFRGYLEKLKGSKI